MLDDFIHYLKQEVQNHSIYVWGAQGQSNITEEWIQKSENSTKNAQRAIAYWQKQCELGYKDKLKAFDCSGLGVYWLLDKTLIPYDKNANGLKSLTEKISRNQVKKGDWLFHITDGRATHIGYAINSDQAIECRGRDCGVCITDIDSRSWDEFGRPHFFKHLITETLPEFTFPIKKGDNGDAVLCIQVALINKGYKLNKYGADGNFGNETEAAIKSLQESMGIQQSGYVTNKEAKILELTQDLLYSDEKIQTTDASIENKIKTLVNSFYSSLISIINNR